MEADWEFEIGGEAPVIEPEWPGLVDLRRSPHRANELPEAVLQPGMGDVLVRLNAQSSPVWTSKCDVWLVAEFDPDELDAPREAAQYAVAAYLDLLPAWPGQWTSPEDVRDWCTALCVYLSAVPLRGCRADLVIRQAVTQTQPSTVGITTYLTACGATRALAESQLGAALNALAGAVGQAGTR